MKETERLYIVTAMQDNKKVASKIGKSKEPQKRLVQMQTGNPCKLYLVREYECEDAWKAERYLQHNFRKSRIRGEWFELDDADLERIDELVENGNWEWVEIEREIKADIKNNYIQIRVDKDEKMAVKKFTKKTKLRTMSLAVLLATEFASDHVGFFNEWLKLRSE